MTCSKYCSLIIRPCGLCVAGEKCLAGNVLGSHWAVGCNEFHIHGLLLEQHWLSSHKTAKSRDSLLDLNCQELPPRRRQSGPQSPWAGETAKLKLTTANPNVPSKGPNHPLCVIYQWMQLIPASQKHKSKCSLKEVEVCHPFCNSRNWAEHDCELHIYHRVKEQANGACEETRGTALFNES